MSTGTLFSDNHQDAPYIIYDLVSHYFTDEGVQQLPIAGPVGSSGKLASSIIQTHAPCGWRVVTFNLKRRGKPPVAPDRTPPDSNHTLLRTRISIPLTELDGDGVTPIHSISGEYVYSLTSPIFPSDDLPAGWSPVLRAPGYAHTAKAREFSPIILVPDPPSVPVATYYGISP